MEFVWKVEFININLLFRGSMERIEELCCYYVALIRAVYLVHQNHHWVTKGDSFYGDHLLFERIYKGAAEDADLAAEKMIGLFGTEVLDLHLQAQMIGKTLEEFSSGDPVGTSLEIEKKFIAFSEKFYKLLKQEDKMTLGLDDMLMSIASNREGAVYLLQQVQGHSVEEINPGDNDMNSRMAARKAILRKLAQAAQTQAALDLQKKIATALNANILSKNWGQSGVDHLQVTENNGAFTVQYNVVIPANAPPFTNKKMYPQGLNQFKQEVMNIVTRVINSLGVTSATQVITVNGA